MSWLGRLRNLPYEKLIENYIEWARLQYSETTVKTYAYYIKRFVEENGVTENISRIVNFINSFPTYNSKMVAAHALISFFEFLGRPDIASRIPKPRGSANPPKVLTYDFNKLRRAIMALPTPRERAMMCVAYELALRAREVLLLKRNDFDPETCRIKIYRVKRPQGIPEEDVKILPPYCCRQLQVYLETRSDRAPEMFLTESGTPLTYQSLRRVFKKLARILGVPEAHLHQLRHTAITERAQSLDLMAVAKYAGHRNPASSLIYIHMALEHLIKRLSPADREKIVKQLMEQLGMR
jgi:integrase